MKVNKVKIIKREIEFTKNVIRYNKTKLDKLNGQLNIEVKKELEFNKALFLFWSS